MHYGNTMSEATAGPDVGTGPELNDCPLDPEGCGVGAEGVEAVECGRLALSMIDLGYSAAVGMGGGGCFVV